MDVNVTGMNSDYNRYQTYNERKSGEKNSEVKQESGVVYEKSQSTAKATYSVAKMSESDRTELVNKLKGEQATRQQQLVDIVKNMMGQQAGAYKNVWQFLASGEYEVDVATKAQAQKDISEDGYYGVKQTSERLFDFAMALAGDDPEKMKEMQAAVEKGFKLATKDWGKELPGICKDTLDATNKLFEDYFSTREAG